MCKVERRATRTPDKRKGRIRWHVWRRKRSLLTGYIRRAPLVEIRNTGLLVAKASMETTV
jgi:hypothetical protein